MSWKWLECWVPSAQRSTLTITCWRNRYIHRFSLIRTTYMRMKFRPYLHSFFLSHGYCSPPSWCHLRPISDYLSRTPPFRSGVVCVTSAPYHDLVTSEMWCWSGGRGILTELSLCYSIVCHYNGAQRYEQFLQVGRLYRILILLSLALCLHNSWI